MKDLKKLPYLMPLLLLLMLGACKKDVRHIKPTPVKDPSCKEVVQANGNDWESGEYRSADWITIHKARIEGDYLRMHISYSGCSEIKDSELRMLWNGYLKSSPAQVTMNLTTSRQPEMCAAYFEQDVCFDVSPIQLDGTNLLYVNLNNYNERLEYRYGEMDRCGTK